MIVVAGKYFMGKTGKQLSLITNALTVIRHCKRFCAKSVANSANAKSTENTYNG